jgi:TolA-binding protein
MNTAPKGELTEKAAHKLAWAYFRDGDYQRAEQTFRYQRATFPEGPLASDATFMQAESLFKQDKFEEALKVYGEVENPSSPDFAVLTLLHSAQAAAQLKNWEQSLELLQKCAEQYPDSPYMPEVLYEQGWAQQNLGNLDEAMKRYEAVVDKTSREVAARAQFMIGEVLFEQKNHTEAVKAFFKVMYGYSYPQWQADATYEAARCFEVMKKTDQAIKLYQELVEKFPKSDKVSAAKERLDQLKG